MKKKNYTTEERTENQFKAIELKKHGWFVTRIVEDNPFGEESVTIAFGYNPSETMTVKDVVVKQANLVKESDFEFVYYN
jgi:hypothetical protein